MSVRLGFRLRQLGHDLRSGLLFRPLVLTGVLALLALGLVELERRGVIARWRAGGWFFANDPGAAQAVLAAIAGSMMSVVSIVYSVLVVALSLASVQFSPRILGNFIRDRASQHTLGVLIGTFAYCLLVMRSMSTTEPWVPTWATATGLALGVVCIGFLIYFLHHIATNIQVANIIQRISDETEQVICEVYPSPAKAAVAEPRSAPVSVLEANRSGYLQLVDHEGLAALARHHRLTLVLRVEPGDYVARGDELARVLQRGSSGELSQELRTRFGGAFDLGPTRTMQQDVAFGLRQLVDIALKAISPAVNDPSTATLCIDRLGSLLAELAPRRPGARTLLDGEDVLVYAPQPNYTDLIDLAFNQLRQYGKGDLAVSIRIVHALARAGRACALVEHQQRVRHHAELLRAALAESFQREDRERFEAAIAELEAALAP